MRIFLIALCLILSACAPSGANQSDPPRDESAVPGGGEASAGDAKACTDHGGSWRRVCMMGKWSCVKNYADAGKVCKDKKDCQGQCRYQGDRDLAPGSPATGVCQRDSDPCGCFAEVRDGKLQHALCVD
jgi:hypothetical protein